MQPQLDYTQLAWEEMVAVIRALQIEMKRRNPIGINMYMGPMYAAHAALDEIARAEKDHPTCEAGPGVDEEPEPVTAACAHVPARPDVDLTLCWLCGIEIIPDPDTHLWRPLTASETLVKYETIRELRNLFLWVHPHEFNRILLERLETKSAPAIRLAESLLGRWIIVNGLHDDLAWSGSRWVPHRSGLPAGPVQISNWETREQAAAYAAEHFPERQADAH